MSYLVILVFLGKRLLIAPGSHEPCPCLSKVGERWSQDWDKSWRRSGRLVVVDVGRGQGWACEMGPWCAGRFSPSYGQGFGAQATDLPRVRLRERTCSRVSGRRSI